MSGHVDGSIRIRRHATAGGSDDAERFSRTEDGKAHGGAHHIPGRYGDVGARVWYGGNGAAGNVVVGVIDYADDHPAELIDHPHLVAAAAHDGDAADNRPHDSPSVDPSNNVDGANDEYDDRDDR